MSVVIANAADTKVSYFPMADRHSPIALRARAARQRFQRWPLESSDVGILSYGQDGVFLGL
jgi:hypothetical protein